MNKINRHKIIIVLTTHFFGGGHENRTVRHAGRGAYMQRSGAERLFGEDEGGAVLACQEDLDAVGPTKCSGWEAMLIS